MLHEDTYAPLLHNRTTGLPKGVMFTHRALYLMCLHLITLGVLSNDPEAEHIGEAGVTLLNVPLFHIHGWGAPYLAVFTSTRLVLPGYFTVDGFCKLVESEKVTSTQAVLRCSPCSSNTRIERSMTQQLEEACTVGGAALPWDLKKGGENHSSIKAASGYGMTENSAGDDLPSSRSTTRTYLRKNARR
jgi:acyl-CoA synthetase (AMP-forming)/AMP-acid ligase II